MKVRIKEIKDKYKVTFIERIGQFENPLAMVMDEKNIFLVVNRGDKNELKVINPGDGGVLEAIELKGKVECFTYSEAGNFVILNFLNDPALYKLDLNSKQIEKFTKDTDDAIARVSLKMVGHNVYALDHLGHSLKIYDDAGNIERHISFREKFEFPIQFLLLPSLNKILLTRFDGDFYKLQPGLYQQYGNSACDPGTNLGYYDLKDESITCLPPVGVDFGRFLWYISSDRVGNIFITNVNSISKLDRDFNMVFTGKVSRLVPSIEGAQVDFYNSFIVADFLYILKRGQTGSIYKFAIR